MSDLIQMAAEMENVADVADKWDVTNAVPAIRCWAERLRALSESPSQQAGWLPIDSAPKDGSWMLLWHPGCEGKPLLAQWHINCWRGQRTLSGKAITWRNPTHWMPLPNPPQEASA